jgi:beta-lactamase regulating signal transducer with metallopeptidase domain
MTNFPFNELAQLLSERMVNGVAVGVVLALLAWMLLRLAGKQNSSTRFAVWFAALVAVAALPLMGTLVPQTGMVGEHVGRESMISLPASWARWLVLAWAVVATIGLLRLVVGLIRLRKVRANAVPIDVATLDPVLRETLANFRSSRKVTLCVSDQQPVPAAMGFFRPLIVLPPWTMHELSTAELNSILIHELAHLQRWDDWTNLVQKVLRAVLFFHPAVWWIESQLSLEREMACDDAVLSKTENARAYAECLVSMAEKSFLHRTLALAQAAVSRMRQTSQRVAQILRVDRPNATRVWRPALGLVATFAVVCGVSQSHAPELVAFRDSAPGLSAVADLNNTQSIVHLASLKTAPLESSPVQNSKLFSSKHAGQHKAVPRFAGRVATEAELNQPAGPQAKTVMFSERPVASQTMLVVFHGAQYDSAGQIHWTVFVWQVNLQQSIPASLPAKRT